MSVIGKRVVHCHGKKKGKTIAKGRSRAHALKIHRAIMANKARRRALA